MNSRLVFTGACLAILLASPRGAAGVDWEKLVMPGPVVTAHAKYEADCSACHKAFDTSAQRGLCLHCHEDVAGDIASKVATERGFHGRQPLAASGECRSCHTDHKGRGADIRGLSEATFDHGQTDYPLEGAHQSAACGECHPPDQRRREAPKDCIECHRADDAHDGALSTDCARCHGETSWKSNRFDHDKTEYRLEGAHREASCVGCHAGDRYKDTPRECVTCHSIDDSHAGRFGDRCGDCHGQDAWRTERFDHEKKSEFALLGAHGRATCGSCHREAPGKQKLPKDCNGCHATEDVHAGRFGSDCGDCHRSERWPDVRFDHGKKSRFPLRGAHGDATCVSCHSGPRREESKEKTPSCFECHARDDVHRGKLGRDCGDCHGEVSFFAGVAFDHELTSFPLLGLHAMVGCESCHGDHTYRLEEHGCQSCHAADDIHEGALGSGCASCHNPNGWAVWRFDHGERTSFALDGAHENLECATCHRKPLAGATRLAKSCVGCHSSEDPHRGGFGRGCDACHGSEAWKPASLGRSLKGAKGERK